MKTITIEELLQLDQNTITVLDVRPADAYIRGSVPGAVSIPLAEVEERMEELPKEKPVYVLCHTGEWSVDAVYELEAAGYDAANIEGGYRSFLRKKLSEFVQDENTTGEKQKEIERSIIKKFRKGIWRKFTKGIREYDLIQDGDKIAVCISGGKDSMLMAKLFQELLKHGKANFELVFLVMNPGYNEDNWKIIQDNAKVLGIPLTVFETQIFDTVADIDKNPCYLCARMRRGALHDAAKQYGCNKIALGHHYNDAIETFIMNLFNEGRIGCFSPKSYLSRKDITLIRPLVFAPEKEICKAALKNELNVVKSKCPADGHTNREKTKNFIRQMDKENSGFSDRIFGAMRRSNIDGWGGVGFSESGND